MKYTQAELDAMPWWEFEALGVDGLCAVRHYTEEGEVRELIPMNEVGNRLHDIEQRRAVQ